MTAITPTASPELTALLMSIAQERWSDNRKEYNRMFMAYGPGCSLDAFKASPRGTELLRQDALLSAMLCKDALKGAA